MNLLISQLTARIFIGEELCRNRDWIQNAISYTAHRTAAMKELHGYGRFIPLAHWFLPSCRALRGCVKAGRPFVERVLEARRTTQGKGEDKSVDALSWIDGVAGENGTKYDATLTQLRLAYAAVHTTSDMMTKVVAALCEHQELLQPLREEIVTVVKEHGWSEAALAKMVLLDSVLKETQRLEPLASCASLPLTNTHQLYAIAVTDNMAHSYPLPHRPRTRRPKRRHPHPKGCTSPSNNRQHVELIRVSRCRKIRWLSLRKAP